MVMTALTPFMILSCSCSIKSSLFRFLNMNNHANYWVIIKFYMSNWQMLTTETISSARILCLAAIWTYCSWHHSLPVSHVSHLWVYYMRCDKDWLGRQTETLFSIICELLIRLVMAQVNRYLVSRSKRFRSELGSVHT